MNNLRKLEESFQNALRYHSTEILDQIVGTEKASAEVRLAIYADGYRLRLLEALKKDYPALNTLMG
ncbi:MAG: DNA-binding domain-containing protein, partial [Gammaproteobacteria bacterium]|nr:DNA-binding domain-containing protein [Gammaproteobacteria bacterium]